jgi:apolipoprotein N-acyltransferase
VKTIKPITIAAACGVGSDPHPAFARSPMLKNTFSSSFIWYCSKDFFWAVVSSLLLIFSYPRVDYGFLAWIGLAPLLLSLYGRSALASFLIGLLTGSLFFSGLLYWILQVPKYSLLHYAVLMPYFGLFFGLFGLAYSVISKKLGIMAAHVSAPFVWVCLEYVRSNLGFMALPWGLLAHSQYMYPPVTQISAITGAYGVSFLIVLVNSTLSMLVLSVKGLLRARQGEIHALPSKRWVVGTAVFTGICLLACLCYGWTTLSKNLEGQRIRISVVQGNIPQDKKWDADYADFIMGTYNDLTMEASKEKPALIAWPETATPRAMGLDAMLHAQVSRIGRNSGAPLLLGSAERRKFENEGSRQIKHMNSAFLVNEGTESPKGQRYDKIKLLPFGEYVPGKGIVPWSKFKVDAVRGYEPGKEFFVFSLRNCRFSVPICWEIIFPNNVRLFVKNGAQFIVNITNAAYFGKTSAAYQVLAISTFRAVENRVYVAIAANIGVSGFIDPFGRIVSRVKDSNGEDLLVRGVLTDTIVPLDEKTFYTQHGDVFVKFCFAASAVFLLLSLFKGKQAPESPLISRS